MNENLEDFLVLLNRRNDGYRYRLPTAEEWTYAAREGKQNPLLYGGNLIKFPRFAWLNINSLGQTQHVAQLLPNRFGLFDMIGNVSEMVTPDAASGKCGLAGIAYYNRPEDDVFNIATAGYKMPYGPKDIEIRCPKDLREFEGVRLVRERIALATVHPSDNRPK